MKGKVLKIAKGAGYAGVGAALAYAVHALSGIDFGQYAPVVSAALSVVANALHKLTPDDAPPPTSTGLVTIK